MKVVILCGGTGMRLREETEFQPKPMVRIGPRPILWHIMNTYAKYGFADFVLCLGYKGEVIRDYFYHYRVRDNDFTVDLASGDVTLHAAGNLPSWKVTLADTGQNTMTGARIKRVEQYVDGDTFMVTYGDGLTDLNIADLLAFHRQHGKIGTVTAVSPPSRYGELTIEGDHVRSFMEKPVNDSYVINGGYFVFRRDFLEYLSRDEECVLEHEPLESLTRDGELCVYRHRGFWQCMDTYRDYRYLNSLSEQGEMPWTK